MLMRTTVFLLALIAVSACTTTRGPSGPDERRAAIESGVDTALASLLLRSNPGA